MTRLVVVTTPELASGFRLGGARAIAAESAEDAARALASIFAGGEAAVVAVHEPFLAAIEPALRRRCEESVAPVVVALPAGAGGAREGARRARLAEILERAVGYRIRFGAKEE